MVGKVLGSWSGMRKYLEREMLAESLRGRVRYGCTSYVGMEDCRIFEVCVDGVQKKRFSWDTVNSYFIEKGLKPVDPAKGGVVGYWDGFWRALEAVPASERTEYTDGEFCAALEEYRNQSIGKSLASPDALVRMFAVLDRRVGRRTLEKLRDLLDEQPAWLREFYVLRLEAEGVVLSR